ncbi:MAG: hypothetical protein P8077_06355, partial [Gammaproteobacteria bacterium]
RARFNVVALAAGRNIDLLEQQVAEFQPELVATADADSATELAGRIGNFQAKIREGDFLEYADVALVGLWDEERERDIIGWELEGQLMETGIELRSEGGIFRVSFENTPENFTLICYNTQGKIVYLKEIKNTETDFLFAILVLEELNNCSFFNLYEDS